MNLASSLPEVACFCRRLRARVHSFIWPRGSPAPLKLGAVQHTPRGTLGGLSGAGLAGPSAGRAWLCCGSFWRYWGETEKAWGWWPAPLRHIRHFLPFAVAPLPAGQGTCRWLVTPARRLLEGGKEGPGAGVSRPESPSKPASLRLGDAGVSQNSAFLVRSEQGARATSYGKGQEAFPPGRHRQPVTVTVPVARAPAVCWAQGLGLERRSAGTFQQP